MILQSLAGLPAFLVYFCTALFAVTAYLFIYTRVTPYNEFQLIRDNHPSAAISLGLSLLGFTLPLVSAIAHSANVLDCLIWALVALIVQVIVYYLVRIPVPDLANRIVAGELASAIWLGLASLSAGALAREYGFTDLDGSQPDAWRYLVEVQDPGLPADATGYR